MRVGCQQPAQRALESSSGSSSSSSSRASLSTSAASCVKSIECCTGHKLVTHVEVLSCDMLVCRQLSECSHLKRQSFATLHMIGVHTYRLMRSAASGGMMLGSCGHSIALVRMLL